MTKWVASPAITSAMAAPQVMSGPAAFFENCRRRRRRDTPETAAAPFGLPWLSSVRVAR